MDTRSFALHDVDDLRERMPLVLRRRAGWIAVLVALAAAAGAGWWLLRPAAPPVESTLPFASAPNGGGSGGGSAPDSGTGEAAVPVASGATTTSTATVQLVVQAAGTVQRPGVYRLAAGARVDDLVRRAGGLTPDCDRDRINLAAPLTDGERLWFPAKGQAQAPDVVAGGGSASPGAGTASPSSAGGAGGPAGPTQAPTPAAPVDLNTATAEQLDALPGVGPATSTAILAYRDQAGGFRSVDDLLEVRGIGDAKLEQLRPLVTV